MKKDLRQAEATLEQSTAALEQGIKQAEENGLEAVLLETESDKEEKKGKKGKSARQEKLKKALGSNRGIETMLRSAYRVQMDLTGLADNKANMMISINGIIISIIIAAISPKLDSNPWLLIPSSLFLIGTLISIVFAILAARPRVSSTKITLEDLRHSEGNILFFGNFAKTSIEQFVYFVNSLY